MIFMAAILLVGIALLISFFVSQGHSFNGEVTTIKSEEEARLRSIIDKDADLQKQLVATLTTSEYTTRECIDRWQRDRAALLVGAGPKWTTDDLKRRRNDQLAERVASIKQHALRRVGVGGVTIVALTFMLLLAAYSYYAKQSVPSVFEGDPQQTSPTHPAFDVFPSSTSN